MNTVCISSFHCCASCGDDGPVLRQRWVNLSALHDFHVNVLPKLKKKIFKKIDFAYVKIILIDKSWLNQVQIIYSIHVT